MMSIRKRMVILLLGAGLSLALAAATRSAIPPFPFQNTQQLGPGILGLPPYREPEMGVCPDEHTSVIVFSFGIYTANEGAHGWQVWVELRGPHFTGAFFDGGTAPKAIYTGTVNETNGHMTLLRSEPFDPQRHHSPCDEWK